MSFDVVTFGDLVADLLLPTPSLPLFPQQHQIAHEFAVEPGGMGNYLVMAQRLGLRCAAIDALGDEDFGRRVVSALRGEGVDTAEVSLQPGNSTALAAVIVDDAAQHVFLGVLGSAAPGRPTASQIQAIREARAFYTNGYSLLASSSSRGSLAALRIAREAGALVIFDPGPLIPMLGSEVLAQALSSTDALLLTLEEARMMVEAVTAERAAVELLARGPRLVAVKLGAEGSLFADAGGTQRFEPLRVLCRDTCGAGDAFDAACTFGLLSGMPLGQMGILANAVGAAAVTVLGAGTRLPHREAIARLLRESPPAGVGQEELASVLCSLGWSANSSAAEGATEL